MCRPSMGSRGYPNRIQLSIVNGAFYGGMYCRKPFRRNRCHKSWVAYVRGM
jgi:hypothetical protein